jgi:SPP1 family predicted phage head-tail adaptor
MLSAAQLSGLRTRFAAMFLTDSVSVLTVTGSRDPETGDRITETESTDYAAIVEPVSSSEATKMGFETDTTLYSVTLPHDATVTMKDRIEWGSRTLEVVQVLAGDTNQIMTECLCLDVIT